MSDITEVNLPDITLKAGQTIDYKGATETRSSIGRIVRFKYAMAGGDLGRADETSLWMLVSDMSKEANTEWISIRVWHNQFTQGLFANTKPNASKKPEVTGERPF